MRCWLRWIGALWVLAIVPAIAKGQTFGVELNNTLMPASGGMAGTSIARPQDLTSAVNANPATLTQFKGTQATFSGAWAEGTFDLTQSAPIPLLGIQPFSGKSEAQGSAVGNIGVTQDFSALGLPATFGVGFVTTSGLFADFRQFPASNGTNTGLSVFSAPVMLGVDLTDRLHVGAGMALGIGILDPPFVGIGGMTLDYALRGNIGASYDLTSATNIAAYYQTRQHFNFDNAIRLPVIDRYQDVNLDMPQNIGLGIANRSLADGRLLLAVDTLYKLWGNADTFKSVYDDQFVVQIGSQYTMGRIKLRSGYAWAQNPLAANPTADIGGVVPPGGLPAYNYTQALLAVTNPHRLTFGVGISDALPGVDLDLMAGGMFRDTEQIGASTTTSIASYWIGTGVTWRFGRGSCCRLPVVDTWNSCAD